MMPPPASGPVPPAGPDRADPEPAAPGTDPRRLFTGEPRLGWVFRDRRELVPAYREPQPGPEAIQAASDARVAAADERYRTALRWFGKPSIVLALLLVLLAACAQSAGGGGFSPLLALITGIIVCGPGLGYTGWCWLERDKARDLPPDQAYQRALGEWRQRAARHADVEMSRLSGVPEWGAVTVPARRTDIFGGTLTGWQGLLAVHGSSLLAGRPLLIADLTGQQAAAPLLSLAQQADIPSVTWRLPSDLGRSGILQGLPPEQLAAAVAEALHAGAPGGARTERAADTRTLRQLATVLTGRGPATGAGVTMPRLAAAVRAALGQPAGAVLSAAEQDTITGSLFPPGTARDQAAPSLYRLDAVLPGLASRAGDGWPAGPARCTCLSLDAGPRSADGEILAALVIQWITVQASSAGGEFPAVIVAGADEAARPHLERLSEACELRGVPLTLLFRHLRDDAVALLGGAAATAFMRLGNHTEAEQAAGYLGRHHTFAMSSFTATRGASTTSTSGGGTSHGTSEQSGKGSQGAGLLGMGGTSSRTRSAGTSESRSENWSTAAGANWSAAQGLQRVYEYRLEPTVLQDLPEQALLLADRSPGVLRLRAVECDPSIITLPGASTSPFPPLSADAPQPHLAPPAAVSPAVTSGPMPAVADDQPAGPEEAAVPRWPRAPADNPLAPAENQPPPGPAWKPSWPKDPRR